MLEYSLAANTLWLLELSLTLDLHQVHCRLRALDPHLKLQLLAVESREAAAELQGLRT